MSKNTSLAKDTTLSGARATLPRVLCEHCGVYISKNVYSRNHGDKCPYMGAPPGSKKCKSCGKFVPVENFSPVAVNTFDGRNSACNKCLSLRYAKHVVETRTA